MTFSVIPIERSCVALALNPTLSLGLWLACADWRGVDKPFLLAAYLESPDETSPDETPV